MRRAVVAFVLALAAGILSAPLTGDAQQPAKVFRIGILATVPPTTPEASRLWEVFFQGLRELGYVDGTERL
ncbi:MAG: hypothetical protein HYV92_10960 [Candidatus Rokubacteria bacterium]|nr:hypothetical protein [Candidatus Rokubacteria bacterium]MBI2544899.1 hypothetical protein [Candidatus Rokubacteria bacterium]MBI2554905.1 hypothetical protein [Candidatus Rokubacteria bacterium]